MGDVYKMFIKCKTYQPSLIQNICKLRESGTLVDCTLKAEGKYLKAHKIILAASSTYFAELFSKHHDEDTVFTFTELEFETLKSTVEYMYNEEVVVPLDQLEKFLSAGNGLKIKGLFESETLNPSIENNNIVLRQNFLSGCQIENSSTAPQEMGIDSMRFEDCLTDDSISDASTTIFREDSHSPVLAENCESDFVHKIKHKQFVSALELATIDDYVDDSSFSDVLTDIEAVFFQDSTSREVSQSSNSRRGELEKIIDPNSTLVTEENQKILDLEVTHVIADTSKGIGDVIQRNSQSSFIHSIEAKKGKTVISDQKVSKNLSSANLQDLKKKKLYSCPQCGCNYKTTRNLNKHLNNVCGKKPQFQCDICQRKFKQKDIIARHMLTHGRERKTHLCPQCGCNYKTTSTLNKHLNYVCGKVPQFQCDICQRKFKQKFSIVRHMLTHELERQKYLCQRCGHSYKVLDSLKQHLRHECGKEPQFQCDICQRKMSQKRYLVRHMRQHN